MMNRDCREYVLRLLTDCPRREREIALLRFELANHARVMGDELIEAMNFARQDGAGRSVGHVSDKTSHIALNYQEQAERMNRTVSDEISARLVELEREQGRLEYYISLLEPRQQQVLRRIYMDRMPRETVAQEVGLSVRRLQEVKAQAIDTLAEMYDFTAGLY